MAKRKASNFAICIGDQLRGKKCRTREECTKFFKDAVKFCKTSKVRR
ncbi:hypothetical protein ES702_07230 [subsurface metagenome]